jgi:hypothetical protein
MLGVLWFIANSNIILLWREGEEAHGGQNLETLTILLFI